MGLRRNGHETRETADKAAENGDQGKRVEHGKLVCGTGHAKHDGDHTPIFR
jgi:hypothetical protein